MYLDQSLDECHDVLNDRNLLFDWNQISCLNYWWGSRRFCNPVTLLIVESCCTLNWSIWNIMGLFSIGRIRILLPLSSLGELSQTFAYNLKMTMLATLITVNILSFAYCKMISAEGLTTLETLRTRRGIRIWILLGFLGLLIWSIVNCSRLDLPRSRIKFFKGFICITCCIFCL